MFKHYGVKKNMRPVVPKPYWNKDWLLREYVIFERTADDIAGQCGVTASCIKSFLNKFDIPIRSKGTHWPLSDYFLNLLATTQLSREEKRHPSGWEPNTHAELTSSTEWQELKLFIYKRDNNTCQRCNESDNQMIVHHILPFHWHIEVLNPKYCILLCTGCHVWVHSYSQNPNMEFLASPIGWRLYFDPRIHQDFAENCQGR